MRLVRHIKEAMDVSYGQSSKALQELAFMAARRWYNRCTPEERRALQDAVIPWWLGYEEVADALTAPAQISQHGPEEPPRPASAAEPPPAAPAMPFNKRWKWSRARDAFQAEHKAEIEASIDVHKAQDKHSAKTRKQLRNLIVSRRWRAQSQEQKEAYLLKAIAAAADPTRERVSGRFEKTRPSDTDAVPVRDLANLGMTAELKPCLARNLGRSLLNVVNAQSRAKKQRHNAAPIRQLFTAVVQDAGISKRKAVTLCEDLVIKSGWKDKRHLMKATTGDLESAVNGGRPRKAYKVSDKKLLERMSPHVSESSRFSLRQNAPRLSLNTSLVAVAGTANLGIGYRQLCRRVQGGRLGVGPSKSATDVCEICHAWDHQVAPRLSGAWKELQGSFEAVAPGFFNEVLARPGFSLDKSSEVQCIIEALEAGTLDPREGVPELAASRLEAWTANRSTVEEYGFHFDLNRYLKEAYNGDRSDPRELL